MMSRMRELTLKAEGLKLDLTWSHFGDTTKAKLDNWRQIQRWMKTVAVQLPNEGEGALSHSFLPGRIPTDPFTLGCVFLSYTLDSLPFPCATQLIVPSQKQIRLDAAFSPTDADPSR